MLVAQYQLLSSQTQVDKVTEPKHTPFLMNDLLDQFEKLWLKTTALPKECADIETAWQAQGKMTSEKIRLKALNLAEKKAKNAFPALIANIQDKSLQTWLTAVAQLVNEPKNLPSFIENITANGAVDEQSKQVVNLFFPQFIKTIAEDVAEPSFEPYQQWAQALGLNDGEQKAWKIAFLNRLFDNGNLAFQMWRDEQIRQLQADNLTERRIRMALWQQNDTAEWLSLLSGEGKAKLEWRYWTAKNEKDPVRRKALFGELAKERGFYPMLAAQQLGELYQFKPYAIPQLGEEQAVTFAEEFAKIAEWRALNRFEQARSAWINWITSLSLEEQLMIIDYAHQQNWYDLAVEGTIQAKAFDYIHLRLPKAYSDWFDINLADSPVSKSFAMAIARQESAWNAQAKSHANALGLMQMLPSTAQKTATDNQLPFASERDLLQPFNNIMLGTTHLRELHQEYEGNRALMAAAYNAGAGRVKQWLTRADGRLSFDEFVASIPYYETRGYVQNVLAYDYYYQKILGEKRPTMFYKNEVERKY